MKKLTTLLGSFMILMLFFQHHVLADSSNLSIYIDGKQQVFDPPPVIQHGTTLVPVRGVLETMGATVGWNAETKTVSISKDLTTIHFKIGSQIVEVNKAIKRISVPAQIIQDRTFVPLRFISENFGSKVQWDGNSKTIFINTIETHDRESQITNEFHIDGITLGDSIEKVKSILGEPKRQTLNEYEITWNTYHTNYDQFVMIGFKNNIVSSFYTNQNVFHFLDNEAITIGSSKANIINEFGTSVDSITKGNTIYQLQTDNKLIYLNQGAYITFFLDKYNDNKLTAIQIIAEDIEQQKEGFYGIGSETLARAFEFQFYDITNALRKRENLPVLKWSALAQKASLLHSQDMATNQYFSHTNLSGESPFVRMEDVGIKFSTAAENLAMGQTSAIFAHEGLMNSIGHRENIINPNLKELGVGVAFHKNTPYYTQKFYTAR